MKEFKLPSRVNIFGSIYRVKSVKNLNYEAEPVAGLCHKDTKLIEIDAATKPEELKYVYLHEVFHGVVEELSLSEIVGDQLEEILVDTFAKMVAKIDEDQITTAKKAMAAKKKKKTKKKRKGKYGR